MKTYPARFVGEFDGRHWRGDSKAAPNIGDVAIVVWTEESGREHREAIVRCGCGNANTLPLIPSHDGGPAWQLTSTEPINIEPSVLTKHAGNFSSDPADYELVCHYFVHGGQLQMLDDTTAVLK